MEEATVTKMLAYCGYRCDLCAARSDDPELRQRLIDGWRKYYGHTMYTVDNVRCDGCLADGRLADTSCKVRPCCIEKGHENCAYCDEFPCDMLENLFSSEQEYRERYPDVPEEDFQLCMIQFCSRPRLLAIREKLQKE